jgi:hypothetical protein
MLWNSRNSWSKTNCWHYPHIFCHFFHQKADKSPSSWTLRNCWTFKNGLTLVCCQQIPEKNIKKQQNRTIMSKIKIALPSWIISCCINQVSWGWWSSVDESLSAGNFKVHMGGSGRVDQMGGSGRVDQMGGRPDMAGFNARGLSWCVDH